MAKCRDCRGSGKCSVCHGTGSWKRVDPHPSGSLVNPDTGEVKCGACLGKGYCPRCNGSGEE